MVGRLGRRLVIGLGLGAVVLGGALAGSSIAGTGIADPTVVELALRGCDTAHATDHAVCHAYRLRDDEGARSGTVTRYKVDASAPGGGPVGRVFIECVSARGTGEMCTFVARLHDTATTDPGTIAMTSADGETFAVTGGSGAYRNVRGDATFGGGFELTISLIP